MLRQCMLGGTYFTTCGTFIFISGVFTVHMLVHNFFSSVIIFTKCAAPGP